ncbi:MAG TPA: CHRD domain-containing protein [Nitrososphaeraceae archaeon]|nr:CHRD domain-containing protein [Nitrososphaeraceae archaeon]
MNFPTDKTYHEEEKENVDFAAILTGKEKDVPEVDIVDTALATFQSTNNKDEKDDLKYSVKVTDMDKIKEVHIDIGKPNEKEREGGEGEEKVVAELYKSDIPSGEVMGTLCNGTINSQKLKGPLHEKNTNELVRKIEKGEAYVNILTEDKPKGKVRGKIKKLAPA